MGYFVADISGHDLGASFVTSSLKVLLRQNSGPLFTPVETLKNMAAGAGLLAVGTVVLALFFGSGLEDELGRFLFYDPNGQVLISLLGV